MHLSLRRIVSFVASLCLAFAFFGSAGCGGVPDSTMLTPVIPQAPFHFDGPSTRLHATQVVPSLDSPLDTRKSTIWCVAWDIALAQMQAAILHGKPLRLAGVGPVRSSVGDSPTALLGPDSFLVRIKSPGRPDVCVGNPRWRPENPERQQKALPFSNPVLKIDAIVRMAIPFQYDFPPGRLPIAFVDAGGQPTLVQCFGVQGEADRGENLYRKQVRVLFCEFADPARSQMASFAVDLSKESSPYQVVLARLPSQPTLHAALALLEQKMQAWREGPAAQTLAVEDILAVPTMYWRIAHHFSEYEGPRHAIQNAELAGNFLDTASEKVEFTLNRSGLRVEAEAKVSAAGPLPRRFVFDQPFLILVRKRHAAIPAFAMWVKNAELMDVEGGRK